MGERLTAAQYQKLARAEKYGRIPRASKLNRTVDGIVFDSAAEARRWRLLRDMEAKGEISQLQRQPKYQLLVNGTVVGHYVADFEYLTKTGEPVVEDVKSIFTAKDRLYRRNKRHMAAQYGIHIKEVT